MREAKKGERLRFTQAALGSPLGRKAAKLDQARLVRVQRQHKLLHPLPQVRQKALGRPFVLKSRHHIIGVTHEDDFTPGVMLSPAVSPQVEYVMQIDVS